jgi:5-methylcytosine-specific restriction endonuclease McrA
MLELDELMLAKARQRGPLFVESRAWNPFDTQPDERFVVDALESIRAKRIEQELRYARGERNKACTCGQCKCRIVPSLSHWETMYLRQGGTCAYCARRMWFGLQHMSGVRGWLMATEDHILPRSRGGKNGLSNKCLACRWCNEDKADLTASEYLEWRMTRVVPHPSSTNGRAGSSA